MFYLTDSGTRESEISKYVVLIDHDNVGINWRPRALINEILAATHPSGGIVEVLFRAYGGWYEEYSPTPSRYEALKFYSEHCPTLIDSKGNIVKINFEFADELVVAGDHKKVAITHTVVSRTAPPKLSGISTAAKCETANCNLRDVRKWLKRRKACYNSKCETAFGELFVRREQKQVDVHIALDIVAFASHYDNAAAVIVFSNDLDIFPGLASAAIIAPNRVIIRAYSTNRKLSYLDDSLFELGIHQLLVKEEES